MSRHYKLEVVQQPQRARMCGFGDKDRRPITPPPCIKVLVYDTATGFECNVNDINHDHFVITVDLWNDTADQEVNLVGHSSNTASISTTTQTSFQEMRNETHMGTPYGQLMTHYNGPGMAYGHRQQPPPQMHQFSGYQGYLPPPHGYQSTNSAFAPPTQYYPQPASATVPSQADIAYGPQRHSMSMAAAQPQGMFTRNLIGSLSSSAFRLTDTEDKIGIWFVMQDLSVRTEGRFRLRFSFVNISKQNSQPSSEFSMVNMGKSPVLAQCFSEPFQVFSAKKFPGVCESTALSKCFASQGIKIPIRKDGPSDSKKGHQPHDDDEDY